MIKKLITVSATLALLSVTTLALAQTTVFPKKSIQHPKINYHASTTTIPTTPGVRGALKTHAQKPVLETMQGVAKSVSANSFTLTARKADYTVTVPSAARIVNRTWHNISLIDIRNSDKVRVYGAISNASIEAKIIRDISLPPTPLSTHATSTVIHAPRIRYKDGSSTNWSGYAVETNLVNPQNNAVSDVKGSWIVPGVTCGSTNTYSSSWVGIDGYSDNTVEQIGTEQDCINGSPSYYAWFEMYPRMSFKINLSVKANDIINAEVKYVGNNQFQLILADATINKSFITTQKIKASRQSAEWIMEAPWSGGVLPLANFGIVSFNNTQTTINGHSGTISDTTWKNDTITMVNSSGVPKATPSSLSTDGSAFNVTWNSSN